MLNPKYPSFIFQRGNNANIQKLFVDAIGTAFKANLSSQTEEIRQRNEKVYRDRVELINSEFASLQNMNQEYRSSTSSLYSSISAIMRALKPFDTDKSLQGLYGVYEFAKKSYEKEMRKVKQRLLYANTLDRIAAEKAAFQEVIKEKDLTAKDFLDKALSMKTKDEIVALVEEDRKEAVKTLLEGSQRATQGGKRTRRRARKPKKTRRNK